MLGQVTLIGMVPREQAALGARWVLGERLVHQRVARMGREEVDLGEGSEMHLVFWIYDRGALIAHRRGKSFIIFGMNIVAGYHVLVWLQCLMTF